MNSWAFPCRLQVWFCLWYYVIVHECLLKINLENMIWIQNWIQQYLVLTFFDISSHCVLEKLMLSGPSGHSELRPQLILGN